MAVSRKYLPRRERIRSVERHTLERTPGNLRAARRTFRHELTPVEQMHLAQEIADTRGAELCRAYRNVIDISAGFKERRDRRTGKARILRRPCVIFSVKRKWSDDTVQPDQKLPEHLFAYWTVGDERKLCAVPTDVEDADRLVRIRPQSGAGGIAVELPPFTALGVITCAIRRSTFPNAVYAVSCRHVFSVASRTHPRDVSGVRVTEASGGSGIAKTIRVKGKLQNGPEPSLDAQLARITNTDALRRLFDSITLTGFLESPDDIPAHYWLIPPDRDPIKAEFRKWVFSPIDYGQDDIASVVHSRLIESFVSKPTFGGDSGAPLVTGQFGGVLLGMHIAGDKGDTSRAIPAWSFMFPDDYGGAASTEEWTFSEI